MLLAIFAFSLVWFGTLEYRKLIKPDEGRYAEISREMVVSGNWITPRLNGIKYFEKPPLQYWATAAAFEAFGEDEWTARLWTGLTGFLGIVLAWFAGRRLFGAQTGILAAAMLGSSLLYLLMGHINTLDMGLTFFLEAAVFCFLLAQQAGTPPRPWMLAAWSVLGLAVLSKGIVAPVLTGGTLVLYSLLTRDWSPWRKLELGRGIPLFLIIAAPWFVAVSMANPEFARFFFIHEHFERFLTTVHHRDHPVWYFVPILLLGALPWTTLGLQALAGAWRRPVTPDFQPRRFLLLWCIAVFGFFSASSSKLPSYILPLFPALALLTADALPTFSRRALTIHLSAVAVLAAIALALVPLVAKLGDDVTTPEMMAAYARWLAISAAIWLTGCLAALHYSRRDRRQAAALTLAAAAFIAGCGVLQGHEKLGRSNSSHDIARKVLKHLPPGVPFYSVGTYEQTLPFYLQRTVTLVEYRDEFSFGQDQEPEKWIPSIAEFKRRWQSDPDAFAFMTPDQYRAFEQEGLPMTEVARDTRRVIVRNRPRQ